MSELTVRPWTELQWAQGEAAWQALLAASGADPLFLSWRWLRQWWTQYAGPLSLEAEILGFYRGGELVGLAPLYRRAVRRGWLGAARSVQFMGLAWRDPVPLISEYLDVIALPGSDAAVRSACLAHLDGAGGWNEFVVGFTPAAAHWLEAHAGCPLSGRSYARELDRSVSYQADLGQGFAAYLKDLGQSTRRSIWNLRRRLADEHGEVRLEQVGAADVDAAFADLNRLHELRWGRPAFPGERLLFHRRFAAEAAARGELAITRLWLSGSAVSVVYDVRTGRRQYNIKMGFDPRVTSRASIGLIHLGYAMEAAAERDVTLYDFLAGPGQTYDFKRNLGHIQRPLSCVQMVRGRWLPTAYRWRDRLRRSPHARAS